jgi:hypothetical protein
MRRPPTDHWWTTKRPPSNRGRGPIAGRVVVPPQLCSGCGASVGNHRATRRQRIPSRGNGRIPEGANCDPRGRYQTGETCLAPTPWIRSVPSPRRRLLWLRAIQPRFQPPAPRAATHSSIGSCSPIGSGVSGGRLRRRRSQHGVSCPTRRSLSRRLRFRASPSSPDESPVLARKYIMICAAAQAAHQRVVPLTFGDAPEGRLQNPLLLQSHL